MMLCVAIRGRRTTGVLCGVAIPAAGLFLCGAPARAKADDRPVCAPSGKAAWTNVEGFKPFRIWFNKDAEDAGYLETRAKYLVQEMDSTIWPKLTESMNTKPISKPLGICLVKPNQLPGGALAITKGEGIGCGAVGAYIQVGEGTVGAEEKKSLRDTLAHEFMHVLQDSLDVSCPGTYWWREATANWAMDEAYPGENLEHDYAPAYLKDMDNPLPTDCDSCLREYGSYVFPFWIARSLRPGLIGDIWHRMQTESTLDAINDELPGGFKKQWPRFGLDSWNQDPVDYYKSWDGLDQGASTYTKEQELSPGSDVALNGVQKLQHLSAKYFTFKVAAGVRTLGVQIPSPYHGGIGGEKPDPHANVQAIVDLSGGNSEVLDWTGKFTKNYCFALPHQHVTSLTLVFSNSDTENDFDGSEPGYVIATNVGCKGWSGTITSELDNPHGDTGLKIKQTAEVTYERQKSSPDDSLFYASVKGGGSWSGSWQTSSGASTCTYSGSGTWDANPTVGYMIMYWGSHSVPGFLDAHGYGGSLGGPLFDVLDGHCSDGSSPLADGTLAGWDTGPTNMEVSANGLTMHGHYGENLPDNDGYETWDWNLTSSG
jgi:hypothetical protein